MGKVKTQTLYIVYKIVDGKEVTIRTNLTWAVAVSLHQRNPGSFLRPVK